MAVKRIKSVKYYLQNKKVFTENSYPRPTYELGTLHPHARPVTEAPYLRYVDSPGTKVLTGETNA